MLKLVCLCFVLSVVHGHNGLLKTDAEMQSALMPQELNPAFVSEKDSPMRMVLPLDRYRRDSTEVSLDPGVGHTALSQVKKFSRIVACVVLGISAVTEIILYLIEVYYN